MFDVREYDYGTTSLVALVENGTRGSFDAVFLPCANSSFTLNEDLDLPYIFEDYGITESQVEEWVFKFLDHNEYPNNVYVIGSTLANVPKGLELYDTIRTSPKVGESNERDNSYLVVRCEDSFCVVIRYTELCKYETEIKLRKGKLDLSLDLNSVNTSIRSWRQRLRHARSPIEQRECYGALSALQDIRTAHGLLKLPKQK